ncbi:glycosyltransferase [Vibrio panuliri]|uniref:Glycosyltransferase subfamily 4-like N-terminal domain-containing protein n=1 Tax=Vibrio panuliri TaxID=1381081 RepID=A0ABX3FIE8_9VIBR|nr:glycosyltransferase [Vibrio panuliri]KAB1459069.1 glycosyltransferase family 4 protein [Vibrio panuliri]OLQ93878.1 hypothetical protein BIY20_08025 [Vibrio panuliri]
MKIIYILDFLPFDHELNGLSKIYYNLIKNASLEHDVDIIIFTNDEVDNNKSFYNVNNIFYETNQNSALKRNLNRLKGDVFNAISLSDVKKINEKYNLSDYDIIHTAHLFFSKIAKLHPNVVVGATDASSLAMTHNGNPRRYLRKLYFRAIEAKLSRQDVWIHTVTERDRAGFDTDKSFVITNGVDSDIYKPLVCAERIPNSFVFHGNLDYKPNQEAIVYMSGVLKKESPSATLYVVGRGEPGVCLTLDNVEVVGEVSDIAQELCKYEKYLILMTSGTGVKNKLLEALSCGCNVIANELAINGIEPVAQLREVIQIYDGTNEISSTSSNISKKSSRGYIEKYHGWKLFTEQFYSIYEKIISASK